VKWWTVYVTPACCIPGHAPPQICGGVIVPPLTEQRAAGLLGVQAYVYS
jgi:hypothetical protein